MFGIIRLLFKLIRWVITIIFIGAIVFVGYNAYGVWNSSKLDQRDKRQETTAKDGEKD